MSKGDTSDGARTAWASIISAVQTPLGFFSLTVLVIEALFTVLAALSGGLTRSVLLAAMIVLVFALVLLVTFMAWHRPESLRGERFTLALAAEAGAVDVFNIGQLCGEVTIDFRNGPVQSLCLTGEKQTELSVVGWPASGVARLTLYILITDFSAGMVVSLAERWHTREFGDHWGIQPMLWVLELLRTGGTVYGRTIATYPASSTAGKEWERSRRDQASGTGALWLIASMGGLDDQACEFKDCTNWRLHGQTCCPHHFAQRRTSADGGSVLASLRETDFLDSKSDLARWGARCGGRLGSGPKWSV